MSERKRSGSVAHDAGQTADDRDVMESDAQFIHIIHINAAILFLLHAGINTANYYFISSAKIKQLKKKVA